MCNGLYGDGHFFVFVLTMLGVARDDTLLLKDTFVIVQKCAMVLSHVIVGVKEINL